jgi:hypothetical protein
MNGEDFFGEAFGASGLLLRFEDTRWSFHTT